MTKEEAITREEAIRRIKAWNLDSDDMEVLSVAIPELAESEDEKIRKLLVWQVHRNIEDETNDLERSVYDGIKGHDPDLEESIEDWKKCLDWLEKQKEQKPAVKQLGGTFNSYDMSKTFVDGQYYVMEHPERFGLCKKPAEWSDTDNIGWDEAFACVTCAEKAAKNEEELQNAVTAEKWLKEIKFKYYVHPVKQEWSEEDEDFINMLILHFNYMIDKEMKEGGTSVETYKSYREKLKSLRPQPHTVSIKDATKFGNLEYERGVKDGIQSEKSRHWKPTEEQMTALERASTNKYLSAKQFDILISLKEQLEKQM